MTTLTMPERRAFFSTGMLQKISIGIVSYGAREAAMLDAFLGSEKYDVSFYIVDKQKNPFNIAYATRHVVIPDLTNVNAMVDFFGSCKDRPDFIIPGSETPIINGLRDVVEERLGIPVICPTKEYAIEASKVRQRLLTQEVAPEVNPRFNVWYPDSHRPIHHVKDEVYKWLDDLDYQVAVKPDKPGFGKGVGVWGDHFNSPEEVWEHFKSLYEEKGSTGVIIEEKIEGEEFSLQFFSDGKRLIPLPAVRDYKRRYREDKGPNTGSMGHYDDVDYLLPFMTQGDYDKAVEVTKRKFLKLRGNGYNAGLRGMPFYVAFTCTKDGIKHFEDNSRPGDPEIIGLLAKMRDDFVDVCRAMITGKLRRIRFKPLATVGTYLVPTPYPEKDKKVRNVDLSETQKLESAYGDNLRIYPASMNDNIAGTSRTVYSLGIAPAIPEAREISLAGVNATKGDDLDFRDDIASEEHIQNSKEHMRVLRG